MRRALKFSPPTTKKRPAAKKNYAAKKKPAADHLKSKVGKKAGKASEMPEDMSCIEQIEEAMNHNVANPEDVMEFYSRPRLAPVAKAMGLAASFSLDIVHGWDALTTKHCEYAIWLLEFFLPKFLMCSPPCTFYSALMRMWNYKKMTKAQFQRRKRDADAMVKQAVDSCLLQHANNRLFAFEHPATCSSWAKSALKKASGTKRTYTVCFDQCVLGLRSPRGTPIKKRTRVWTNSQSLVKLSKKQCRCTKPHKRIEGSENGWLLSRWCQSYPLGMVKALLNGVQEDMKSLL